jgi:effector-binding domain-containing protein
MAWDPVLGSKLGGRCPVALALVLALMAVPVFGCIAALAQDQNGAAAGAPSVDAQPLPPLPGTQAPANPAQQSPAPAPAAGDAAAPAAAPAVPATGEVTTLAPPPADPSMPDDVEVAARPAVSLRAASSWDDGYETLTRTFKRLADEMAKAGIKVTGKPISTFLETDDNGFRFEAQLPIEAAPPSRPAGLPAEITFGQTPSGKFIRFVHKSPYDDIDSTYEAVSAYLDSKGVEVKDTFTEEYVNQGTSAGDPSLELFIYVQPKG